MFLQDRGVSDADFQTCGLQGLVLDVDLVQDLDIYCVIQSPYLGDYTLFCVLQTVDLCVNAVIKRDYAADITAQTV